MSEHLRIDSGAGHVHLIFDRIILLFSLSLLISCNSKKDVAQERAASEVINRTLVNADTSKFQFHFQKDSLSEWFELNVRDNKVHITGNSPVALARGAYHYVRSYGKGMVTWAGTRLNMPAPLPMANERIETPYQYRYYFNVVTHGYTTAYWDWPRWEKEIDWMAMHGMNMPLIAGAHEAILYRVFEKIGLTKTEIQNYFSGPAHFPWNRMGNLNGWDGHQPDSYYTKQIALNHKILNRLHELEMTPIVHAFAGFVPKSITRIFPDADLRELSWGGGLPKENNAFILSPNSKYFTQIGKLYIEEWEKEFGKADYYLADSFNEMDVPLAKDSVAALNELAGFGEAVYQSIKQANADATWVMQGWTFPYHRDSYRKRFWTPERLNALVSKVPDEKLLILDMANEYNKVFWKIDPSWKMYDGFFGKKWIYSFIPNMGGKTAWNGRLDVYASAAAEALEFKNKKNLVGFGFAPEGIENNEMVYELLSDIGWTNKAIDLPTWTADYCEQRYGGYPQKMKEAMKLLQTSCYGSFTDHPIHRFQLRPYARPDGVENHATVHRSDAFKKAVQAFLDCQSELSESQLYQADAAELAAQLLGLKADEKLLHFLEDTKKNKTSLQDALAILQQMDSLLARHPTHNLSRWVNMARTWGDSENEKNFYESNARRLLTTWGGAPVYDYAGRVWHGLIGSYYLPRWKNYHENNWTNNQLAEWENTWVEASSQQK